MSAFGCLESIPSLQNYNIFKLSSKLSLEEPRDQNHIPAFICFGEDADPLSGCDFLIGSIKGIVTRHEYFYLKVLVINSVLIRADKTYY
jgi:hypothetical protein